MEITAAEVVSALFGDDGTNWKAVVGGEDVDLEDVLSVLARDKEEDGFGRLRYALPDGSAIVISEGAWDLGFASCEGCYCWPAATDGEHLEGCGHNLQQI